MSAFPFPTSLNRPNSPSSTGMGAAAQSPSAVIYTQRATVPDLPVTQTYDIHCTLQYDVRGPTDFLFQIHAQQGMDQAVLSESLEITPNLPRHVYADPHIGHRFLRLHADAGLVTVRYQARVQRTVQPLDPLAAVCLLLHKTAVVQMTWSSATVYYYCRCSMHSSEAREPSVSHIAGTAAAVGSASRSL